MFPSAQTVFPPGVSIRERASVQVPVKWALLPLFVSVRAPFPHGCKKCKKCPFHRGLHACTLSKSRFGRKSLLAAEKSSQIARPGILEIGPAIPFRMGCAWRVNGCGHDAEGL